MTRVHGPLGPTNEELADVLEQMAELLIDLEEPNPYRVQAYVHAADTVRELETPLAARYGEGGRKALQELPTIGASMASHLGRYIETGRIGLKDRLQSVADPAALFRSVPGIGPKLAARIAGELGLRSLVELERAAFDGSLAALGVGPRRLEGLKLQLNTILYRAARQRARRVRRAVSQLMAASPRPPQPPPPPAPEERQTTLRLVETDRSAPEVWPLAA